MVTLKDRIKTLIITLALILLCTISLFVFLERKYIYIGECAAIAYYQPINAIDIIIIALICMGWYALSLNIIKSTKIIYRWAVGLVYLLLLIIFSFGGNDILESRKIDWPSEYHPQPLEKAVK